MTNFDRITESPEALASFLTRTTEDRDHDPWNDAFAGLFCSMCSAENCEDGICMNPTLANDRSARIAWWLGLEFGGGWSA